MRKLLSVFLLFTAGVLMAQSTQDISGVVYEGDNDQNAIFFANVTLKETNQKMTTDFRGQYNFTALEPGEYTLVFQFLGCETITRKVTVSDNAIIMDAHLNKVTFLIPHEGVGSVEHTNISEL